ncbi:MAG: outer membrane protein assembly factor BamD [Saprospiraceae bacterium]|nr:outer membrane protein assembly factor BamD [Saprospiraceae bacterium]
MNRIFAFFCLLLLLSALTSGCKTKFEKLRASGDVDLIYNKAFEYYDKKDYYEAQVLFEQIRGNLRGKNELEKVMFSYAYSHYHLDNFLLSSYYFKQFANTFVNSSMREEAEFMSAYSNYRMSPSYRLDQSSTEKAIEGLQNFINSYPLSNRVQECNELIDKCRSKLEEKAFAEGKLYYDLKQYQAATQSFDNLLKDYPETKNDEKVRFIIVKANYELAVNSIVDKQEERFKMALDRCKVFELKYPKSKDKKDVAAIRKEIEKKLKTINGHQN